MKKLGYLLGFCVSVLWLTGCASSVQVNQDYDFSKIKTFGFLPIPESAGLNQLDAGGELRDLRGMIDTYTRV